MDTASEKIFIRPDEWARIDAVPGWLLQSAAELSTAIIGRQAQTGGRANVLELGVFRGKYLSALYLASKNLGGKVVGIDAFIERVGVPLAEEWYEHARNAIVENVKTVTGEADRLELVRSDTAALTTDDIARDLAREFSFISIDAGHEAPDVLHDLTMTAPLLAEKGVIAADDVFNSTVPGVVEGVMEFFKTRNTENLAPFALCGNKMFICRASQHGEYLLLAKAFAAAGPSGYRKDTHERSMANTASGYTPHFFGFEVLPFLG